jgi:hypothetical protein
MQAWRPSLSRPLHLRKATWVSIVSKRPIQISVYSNIAPPDARPARRAGLSTPAARVVRGTIAAAICLIAHGLLYVSATWTAGAPVAPANALPTRSSVAGATDEEALQWVAINPDALTDRARTPPEWPSTHLRPIDVRKALLKVAILVPEIDLPTMPEATVADAARLSKMYGRYVGQITARVDRAWLRPRTAIGAPSFSCEVRITQDGSGNVTELMLAQCNGDSRWQLSLVQAIQSASPLPAPPDPDVFTRTLHLAFSADPYSPESPTDQYEPEARARLAQAAQDSQHAEEVLMTLGDSRASGIIRLNITGDHKTVEFQSNTAAAQSPNSQRQ